MSYASHSWTVVNETNRTYAKLVAKIHVYMSIKPKTKIIFHYFEIWDCKKIMLNFMAKVYVYSYLKPLQNEKNKNVQIIRLMYDRICLFF